MVLWKNPLGFYKTLNLNRRFLFNCRHHPRFRIEKAPNSLLVSRHFLAPVTIDLKTRERVYERKKKKKKKKKILSRREFFLFGRRERERERERERKGKRVNFASKLQFFLSSQISFFQSKRRVWKKIKYSKDDEEVRRSCVF